MRQIAGLSMLLAVGCTCGAPTNARDLFLAQMGELCSLYARCGVIGRSQEQKCFSDAQGYYDQYVVALASYDTDAAIRAGRLAIDPGAVNYCLGLLRSSSCSALSGSFLLYLSSCSYTMYKGKVAPGSPCQNALECANGSCQLTTAGNACSGICVAYAVEGASCATAGCDPSRAFCDSSRICRARGNVGAVCGSSSFSTLECIDGLGCTSNKVCARPGAGGEPCASGACQKGFHCVNNVCAADVRHGESCADPGACPDGDRCVGTFPATVGVCTQVLDVGSACDPTHDACPSSAPCSMSARTCTTCQRKKKPGESCTRTSGSQDPCLTGCSATNGTGTCNPPPASCF